MALPHGAVVGSETRVESTWRGAWHLGNTLQRLVITIEPQPLPSDAD